MTDEKLYHLCKQYGRRSLLWRRKFIGLLPEVNKRKLYEKKGCSSIFEFAAKLAGLSQEQVRLALNLEARLVDKPTLRSLLIEGQTSINKLTRVVSIASTENESELAEKVLLLPKKALETLVRDERVLQRENQNENGGANGSNKPLLDAKSLPGQILNFQFSDDVVAELNELHEQGQDVNLLLKELLQKRKEEIEQKKTDLSESSEMTGSRYISSPIKNVLQEEFGKKCSIKTCHKPAQEIHHTNRFGLSSTHDPHYLAPLCREHHVIAHSIDQKVQVHRSFG